MMKFLNIGWNTVFDKINNVTAKKVIISLVDDMISTYRIIAVNKEE